uniref:Uncharacterized protein n=1 Tax=Romanomermis culicivorax TaxID=13658 RepID=A0A915JT67_ROMCU
MSDFRQNDHLKFTLHLTDSTVPVPDASLYSYCKIQNFVTYHHSIALSIDRKLVGLARKKLCIEFKASIADPTPEYQPKDRNRHPLHYRLKILHFDLEIKLIFYSIPCPRLSNART